MSSILQHFLRRVDIGELWMEKSSRKAFKVYGMDLDQRGGGCGYVNLIDSDGVRKLVALERLARHYTHLPTSYGWAV